MCILVGCRGTTGAAGYLLRRNLTDSGSLTSHLPAQATTNPESVGKMGSQSNKAYKFSIKYGKNKLEVITQTVTKV